MNVYILISYIKTKALEKHKKAKKKKYLQIWFRPVPENGVYLTYGVVLWIETVGTFRSDYDYDYEYEIFIVHLVRMRASVCMSRKLVLSSKSRRRPVENYEIFNKTRSPSTTEFRRVLICKGTPSPFFFFFFWNQRRSLKRACCLLLNLAVADFLVGVTGLINNAIGPMMTWWQLNTFLFTTCTLFFYLFVVLMTYMHIAITARLKTAVPACAVETRSRRLIEQNIKLSKSMFVVIGLSFFFAAIYNGL